jgi:hypothetical protein
MLLCLSSGFTPRYRDDVLRAISMPSGSRLRFRYELRLIPESLKPLIAGNQLEGEEVCIAYLDRTDRTRPPELVPCRAARLLRTHTPADFCVIEFELREFFFARDLPAFNREVRSFGDLPAWRDGVLTGHFVHRVKTAPASLIKSASVFDWQSIVQSLKLRSDFATEPFFYFVTGIFRMSATLPIQPTEGRARLRASDTYEIRLVQFSPGETNETLAVSKVCWLLADADEKTLSFVTTRRVQIDSGYDEKIIRFRTLATSTRCDAVVAISRDIHPAGTARSNIPIFDFDILFHIAPRWWTMIWHGLFIGALIAAQGLVTLHSQAQSAGASTGDYTADLLVVILGLLTGLAASFGLRQP